MEEQRNLLAVPVATSVSRTPAEALVEEGSMRATERVDDSKLSIDIVPGAMLSVNDVTVVTPTGEFSVFRLCHDRDGSTIIRPTLG